MHAAVRAIGGAFLASSFLCACVGYSLEVRNIGGPSVRVFVNGQEVGTVQCRGEPLSLIAGANAPALPWDLELLTESGDHYRSAHIDGSHGPAQQLVIVDVGLLELPPLEPEVVEPFTHAPCPDA